jgi:hypothetical protein
MEWLECHPLGQEVSRVEVGLRDVENGDRELRSSREVFER